MGELIDGHWLHTDIGSTSSDGTINRKPSVFRDWITESGSSDSQRRSFKAEPGRYHLYVSLACPWAHRTIILRSLKALAEIVSISIVHWKMGDDGWTFQPGAGVIPDTVNNCSSLHQLYTLAVPKCTSRVTVPVLWDKRDSTIVSNESSEIIRMFNSAFDQLGASQGDYYPVLHRAEIDFINERIYSNLNNGVYRAGFATKQSAYDDAVGSVFETLDWLEGRLARSSYLVADRLTEADIRLFTTLIRFDAVYHGHFKCNRRMLKEYPALSNYTRMLYRNPDIGPTVDFMHIKKHYYQSHPWINPTGIVPVGPELKF